MINAAILTLSDKGSRGERVDTSGPTLAAWLSSQNVTVVRAELIADDEDHIASTLAAWCDSGLIDLILTTGGTGVSPRDVTPDATLRIASRVLPGFAEAMRAESLKKTPRAMISRAVVAIRGATLIINLPGSPRAAIENLEAVWNAVPHAVEKIKGDPADCAPPDAATAP